MNVPSANGRPLSAPGPDAGLDQLITSLRAWEQACRAQADLAVASAEAAADRVARYLLSARQRVAQALIDEGRERVAALSTTAADVSAAAGLIAAEAEDLTPIELADPKHPFVRARGGPTLAKALAAAIAIEGEGPLPDYQGAEQAEEGP